MVGDTNTVFPRAMNGRGVSRDKSGTRYQSHFVGGRCFEK